MKQICGGTTEGNYFQSSELFFTPGPIQGGHFDRYACVFVYSMLPLSDNVVAFSTFSVISLLLQASLPCLLFASIPSTVVMAGDTYFNTSYPLVYMTEVSTSYMLILYLD